MNDRGCAPFVKWAGGKKQLLPELIAHIPEGFGKTITKYAEPFVGGGAFLFSILRSYNLDAVYISDINKTLITTYKTVRDKVDDLVEELSRLQEQFKSLGKEARNTFYYEKREQYNQLIENQNDGLKISSLFIFLNRTCFNGLYRVNARNKFNVPMGDYVNPLICDEQLLRDDSKALQNTDIVCADYKKSTSFMDEKTFVYFDPPYRPLNTTASFTSYSSGGFTDKDQIELANYTRELSTNGIKFLLSNSDPKNTNPNDNFFDDLYSEFKIERIFANRNISSKVEGRKKISELLICNY